MNKEVLSKVKAKNVAYTKYRQSLEDTDHKAYTRARNQARWECRKAQTLYEKKLAKEAKSNPKAFFKYVNSKLKTKSTVVNLVTPDGKVAADKGKAEALNSFFTSVYTREETTNMLQLHLRKEITSPMPPLDITPIVV